MPVKTLASLTGVASGKKAKDIRTHEIESDESESLFTLDTWAYVTDSELALITLISPVNDSAIIDHHFRCDIYRVMLETRSRSLNL